MANDARAVIDRLATLEAQMTPRPWGIDDEVNPEMLTVGEDEDGAYRYIELGGNAEVDYQGILAARNTLPELIECARALKKCLSFLENETSGYDERVICDCDTRDCPRALLQIVDAALAKLADVKL